MQYGAHAWNGEIRFQVPMMVPGESGHAIPFLNAQSRQGIA